MKEIVEPDDERWHDKNFGSPRPFTCDYCGADGSTWEADARCEECDRKTLLPIEIEVEDRDERAW
jgi:hypothetical protein